MEHPSAEGIIPKCPLEHSLIPLGYLCIFLPFFHYSHPCGIAVPQPKDSGLQGEVGNGQAEVRETWTREELTHRDGLCCK